MKYTVIPIIIIFTLFFLNEKNNYPKNKSLILKVSNLKEEDIEINLKNEFRRKPHIDYVDGSILTNTIVLNVNEKKFDKSMIEKSMYRWGLDVDEYVFINNVSISDLEN